MALLPRGWVLPLAAAAAIAAGPDSPPLTPDPAPLDSTDARRGTCEVVVAGQLVFCTHFTGLGDSRWWTLKEACEIRDGKAPFWARGKWTNGGRCPSTHEIASCTAFQPKAPERLAIHMYRPSPSAGRELNLDEIETTCRHMHGRWVAYPFPTAAAIPPP